MEKGYLGFRCEVLGVSFFLTPNTSFTFKVYGYP